MIYRWRLRAITLFALDAAQKIVLAEPPSSFDMDLVAQLWLDLTHAAESGDEEARIFLGGTYGPWASAFIRIVAV